MVRDVLSKLDGGVVASICRGREVQSARCGVGSTEQILQTSCKRLMAGADFRDHFHLPLARTTAGTQEAWVVVEGAVDIRIYDIDDSLLEEARLCAGDCFVLFRGGHGMTVVEATLLYEFKNGPYVGQEADKRWLRT